jgi:branched-chain amino acid aminotransferase
MSLIPFDDRDGHIWMDGKLLPWRDAKIHVLTHGLHYGSCVFEGERAYSGRIFKSREHAQRFHQSGELLGFTIPYSVDAIIAAKEEVLKANNIVNGYFRPVAWRGSEMMAVSAQKSTIHVAIAAWDWPAMFNKEVVERGVKLQMSPWTRPAPNMAPFASKAAGLYMICTLSKHKAESEGFNDAVMLDYRGFVAEATGANLFFVYNGELHTPTPDCFLDGITRRTVMELARHRGIKVVERHILPEEMKGAAEAFLTGSAAEVTPIGLIDDHSYSVGPVTRQLMADYSACVQQPG